MVALEKDKAEYCYALCRALRATRMVEAARPSASRRSISRLRVTAIMAAAPSSPRNTKRRKRRSRGATSKPPASRNTSTCAKAICNDTLKTIDGPVDFVLLDIWTEAVMPAIRNVAPHLRPGAIVIADNTVSARRGYDAYFAFLADPANRLRTLTLPFEGGLEMSVRV